MFSPRRVKIIATVGPATQKSEDIKRLIALGTNAIRLNFSHGVYEDHLGYIKAAREGSKELNSPVCLIQDLQGPKIRVGVMEQGALVLKEGQKYVISPSAKVGKGNVIPTEFKTLSQDVKKGDRILLDDGLLEVKVVKVSGDDVEVEVIYGGVLKDRKGMNVPNAQFSVDALTAKDKKDLEFGLKNGVDYVAMSFVRRADDVLKLRALIEKQGSSAKIIAKIELFQALQNLEEIVEVSDSVMVARGDLAIETGQARLPGIQKDIIRLCNRMERPVITATQMLDSMIENPRPTRAEITDVANAVLDGSDALMLSGETASGKFPFKCIQTMDEVIREVEKSGKYYYRMILDHNFNSVAEAIAASACVTARGLDAQVIVCLTTSGKTATLISHFRPKAQIIAVTHLVPTLNRLELIWGIQTLVIEPYDSTDSAMEQIELMLLQYGIVKPGDKMVLTLGLPVLERGTTNSIRVYTVKDRKFTLASQDRLPLRFHPTLAAE